MIDILIVEDNVELGTLLSDFLESAGYSTKLCETGEEAVSYFVDSGAKLVVLDIMLPNMDGFAVCQKIREKSNAPILIVSAKTEKGDKMNGLILGADDYIEKPYDIDIILAKISGIFKRRYETKILVDGDIKIDIVNHRVYKSGVELSMTSKEFDILLLLVENKGKALKKELIFNKVWGIDSFSEPQTLTVHIKWLREKIEKNPKAPTRILTVWGVGYRFE